MAFFMRRAAACSTLTSYVGTQHGDRSFLLVRERPSASSSAECFSLSGTLDQAVYERLHLSLLDLSRSRLPLVIDLSAISAIDEGSLLRLLKVQRELSSDRAVTFHFGDSGPVLPLISRLGLEERFGLEPRKRLPLTPAAAFAVSRADPEKSVSRDFAAR